MYKELERLNIKLSEKDSKTLEKYIHIFNKYNEKINLVSKNDVNNLFEKHIYDSLAINLFIKDKNIKSLLDIGTGGGFPAVPVAVCFPDIKVEAVDSIKKKIKCIDGITKELNLQNILAYSSRIEDLPDKMKNSFDIVTSRAMAELRIILEYAIPFIKTGGYFIAYKSIKAQDELNKAQNALKLLNTELIDKIEYNLPIEENPKRVLLVFKKLKATDSIYPRKNGIIKKNPL